MCETMEFHFHVVTIDHRTSKLKEEEGEEEEISCQFVSNFAKSSFFR